MNTQNKISINGRFLTQRVTGVQRYAREVTKTLDQLRQSNQLAADLQIEILAPRGADPLFELTTIPVREVGVLGGHLWEQLELPLYSFQNLLVNFCNTGPLLRRRQLITIHDAATLDHPEWFDRKFAMWYGVLLRYLTPRAKKIITDSEFSKTRLCANTAVGEEGIVVIPIGGKIASGEIKQRSVEEIRKHYKIDSPYLLTVGSLDPRKNLQRLFSAWEKVRSRNGDVELFVVGSGGRAFRHGLTGDLPAGVRLLGYVDDADLPALYSGALAFVFPSLYEGFGLPPLEAMQHQCPVIVSHAASIPEVCGTAAVYFDPEDVGEIAHSINQVIGDPGLQSRMRLEGQEQAARFSWEQCAIKTLETIRDSMKN